MTTVLTIDASKIVQSMVTRQLAPYGCTVPAANDTLRHSAETRAAPYAATRDAARRCLQ